MIVHFHGKGFLIDTIAGISSTRVQLAAHNVSSVWFADCVLKLQERLHYLKSPEARKVVHKYNKTAECLMGYQAMYHKAWIQSVDRCKEGMCCLVSMTYHGMGCCKHKHLHPKILGKILEPNFTF